MHQKSTRIRFAETTSSIGAVILGIGLGAIFASHLAPFRITLLLLGVFMHGWGMFDIRSMEKREGERRPLWSLMLYWVCWAVLGVLLALLVAGR